MGLHCMLTIYLLPIAVYDSDRMVFEDWLPNHCRLLHNHIGANNLHGKVMRIIDAVAKYGLYLEYMYDIVDIIIVPLNWLGVYTAFIVT